MFLGYPYYSKVFITLRIIKHVLDYLYFPPPGCPAFGHFTAHKNYHKKIGKKINSSKIQGKYNFTHIERVNPVTVRFLH
jgi:hypothetical protein